MSESEDLIKSAEQAQSNEDMSGVWDNYKQNISPLTYVCADKFVKQPIYCDRIYLLLDDKRHKNLVTGKLDDSFSLGHFFVSETAVNKCVMDDGTLDMGEFCRLIQVSPYRDKNVKDYQSDNPTHFASYRPHLECFLLKKEMIAMYYDDNNFVAAVGNCLANNEYGPGGAGQAFHNELTRLYKEGCLEHDPKNSFSDETQKTTFPNLQVATNGWVDKATYEEIQANAKRKEKNCVENRTAHPIDDDIRELGYPKAVGLIVPHNFSEENKNQENFLQR